MKFTLTDDDGNEIAPPDPTSDVGQIIYLLEYARRRKFVIGPNIQVGSAIVQVKDPSVLKAIDRSEDRDDDGFGADFKTVLGGRE